jgi:hypothetical protein
MPDLKVGGPNPVDDNLILKRLQQSAFNSSHYVWLLSRLQYFQSSRGYLFAYAASGRTTFVALEPLSPNANASLEDLDVSLSELRAHARCRQLAFIGIYNDFMTKLAALGYHGLQIGKDPWVDLSEYEPKGNKGKGIRSARNQAIKQGVTIEEWDLTELQRNPEKRQKILDVHHSWTDSSFLQLEGFLLSADPLKSIPGRRLYVAQRNQRIEGFLLVTPVQDGVSCYFEDLMYRPEAPNGTTELLTLHAMGSLQKLGFKEISLGVVALNNLDFSPTTPTNNFSRAVLSATKKFVQYFYNSEGIELYRKRYQPRRWDNIFIATMPPAGKGSLLTWLEVVICAIGLFKPRFTISFRQISNNFKFQMQKNFVYLLSLAALAHLSMLRPSTLAFVSTALIGWRLLEFLHVYLRRFELALFVVFNYFLAYILAGHSGFGLIDIAISHVPHFAKFFSPLLLCMSFAGLCVNQMRKYREHTFLGLSVLMMGGMIFSIEKSHHALAVGLAPILMFFVGYVQGKIYYEYDRSISQKMARQKVVAPLQKEPPQKLRSQNRPLEL